ALRWLTNAKIIYDVHELYSETVAISRRVPGPLRPVVSQIVDRVEKRLARGCDLIVTVVEPQTELFASTGKPIVTIHNYPRLTLFEPDPRRVHELRDKYQGRRIILYQGQQAESRGLFHMI